MQEKNQSELEKLKVLNYDLIVQRESLNNQIRFLSEKIARNAQEMQKMEQKPNDSRWERDSGKGK